MAVKRGLGRGLDSLIPDRSRSEDFINKEGKGMSGAKKPAKKPVPSPADVENEDIKVPATAKKRNPASKKSQADVPAVNADVSQPAVSAADKEPGAAQQVSAETQAAMPASAPATESAKPISNPTAESAQPSSAPASKNAQPVPEPVDEKNMVRYVKLAQVEPNREQPRKTFNEEKIDELAASIKEHGVIQPLLVQKKDDYYEIIAGERRWRAARKAGVKELPVIVRDYTPMEVVEISLIENIQREDLNPIEEAQAYRRLLEEFDLTQEQVAAKVSRSRSAVANFLRLLNLGNEVQEMVMSGQLSEGHARALLPIENQDVQKTLADQIVKEKLTVRETEKLVRSLIEPSARRTRQANPEKEALLSHISEQLRHILGTKVAIKSAGKSRGRIEIEYYSDDELDRLIDLLKNVQ